MLHKLEIRPAKPVHFTDQDRPMFYPIEMLLDGMPVSDKVRRAEIVMEAGEMPKLNLEIPFNAGEINLDVLLSMEVFIDEKENQSTKASGKSG